MSDAIWLPATLAFLAAVFGTLALALVVEAFRDWLRRRQVAKRVKPVISEQSRKGRDVGDLLRGEDEDQGLLASVLSLVPGLRGMQNLLEQSRIEWSVWTFLVLVLGLGVAAGFASYLITESWIAFWLFAAIGAGIPYVYAAYRRKRRFEQFEAEFPEAIDLLTRAIRAGHPLSSSMGMVGNEGPPEVSMEFRRVFEEQRFGIPFEEALLGMVDRTDLIDVRIFAIAVLVQRDVGGNLAETLENLAETIRRRFYVRRQLRVYTAQGRMTGYALAALPVILGFLIYLLDSEYMTLLFTNLFGQALVGTAIFLQLVGALWIRKIINIEI